MNMQSNVFTASAKCRQLGDLLEFRNEIVHPKDNPKGKAIFVGLEHVQRDTGIRIGSVSIALSEMTGRRARFRSGDIVYGYLRPYLNKVWIADFDGLCSVDQYVFTVKSEFDRNYVAHFLRSSEFLKTAPIDSAPGQLPRIRSGEIAATPIPLPPLDEQRRISAILDKADALCRKRKRALELLDGLTQSIFFEMFGRFQVGSDRWPIVTVAEAGRVQLGRQRAPKYQTGKFSRPYMRVANVYEDRIDLSDVLSMDFDERDFRDYSLKFGDILLNEGQSTELVGRPAMWRNEIGDCCFQNTLVRFQAHENKVMPEFAFGVFINYFRSGAFSKISSKTSSVAHLGASRFGKMPFPLPPVERQKAFVEATRGVSTMKQRAAVELLSTSELFASLQHRAFSGQL